MTPTKGDTIAVLFALGAITIWAGWMSATRIAATEGSAPIDVAFLRYAVPALMLMPVWVSAFRKAWGAPLWSLVAMLGWGLPFVWLVTAALERASVIHLATIVPCTLPIFAVVGERVFFGQKVDRTQLPGFILIGIAAFSLILNAAVGASGADLNSIFLLLLAAAGWAAYTVAFKRTGFTSTEGPAYVCVVSTLLLLTIKAGSSGPFLAMTWQQISFNAIAQGVLSGFVATILYTAAIDRIGSVRTASFSVLLPVLAACIAYLWLGEVPSFLDVVALSLGTLGVAIVNKVISIR